MSNLVRIIVEWSIIALILLVFGWLVTDPKSFLDWLVKLPLIAILWGCFKVLGDFLPESLKKEEYDEETINTK